MLEKQTKILEYIHLQDGNIVIKKTTDILENGVIIASIVSREPVNDVDANTDIPDKIKPHLKAIAATLKGDDHPSAPPKTQDPLSP
jgi:hypothetical protein